MDLLNWNNFAHDHKRSMNPALWDQCVLALGPLGATGGVWRDTSGRGNHGVLTNGPTWEPSRYGVGLRFDNTDDAVDTGNTFGGLGQFTWCGLVNPTAITGRRGLFGNWISVPTDASYIVRLDDSDLDGYFRTSSDSFGGALGTGAAVDEWQLFAVVYDGAAITGYRNGVAGSTPIAASGAVQNVATTAKIGYGGNPTLGKLDGQIALTVFYARALPPAQIAELAADPLVMWRPRPVQISLSAGTPPVGVPTTPYYYRSLLAG